MLWAYCLRSRKLSAPKGRRNGGVPPSGTKPETCARAGFRLRARTALYERYRERPGFLAPALDAPLREVEARLS